MLSEAVFGNRCSSCGLSLRLTTKAFLRAPVLTGLRVGSPETSAVVHPRNVGTLTANMIERSRSSSLRSTGVCRALTSFGLFFLLYCSKQCVCFYRVKPGTAELTMVLEQEGASRSQHTHNSSSRFGLHTRHRNPAGTVYRLPKPRRMDSEQMRSPSRRETHRGRVRAPARLATRRKWTPICH